MVLHTVFYSRRSQNIAACARKISFCLYNVFLHADCRQYLHLANNADREKNMLGQCTRIAKKELILDNNMYADREEAIVCTRVAKEIIVQRNLYYHSEDLLSIALHFEGPWMRAREHSSVNPKLKWRRKRRKHEVEKSKMLPFEDCLQPVKFLPPKFNDAYLPRTW